MKLNTYNLECSECTAVKESHAYGKHREGKYIIISSPGEGELVTLENSNAEYKTCYVLRAYELLKREMSETEWLRCC